MITSRIFYLPAMAWQWAWAAPPRRLLGEAFGGHGGLIPGTRPERWASLVTGSQGQAAAAHAPAAAALAVWLTTYLVMDIRTGPNQPGRDSACPRC